LEREEHIEGAKNHTEYAGLNRTRVCKRLWACWRNRLRRRQGRLGNKPPFKGVMLRKHCRNEGAAEENQRRKEKEMPALTLKLTYKVCTISEDLGRRRKKKRSKGKKAGNTLS